MSQVVLSHSMSLDGYMEGPGRDIGWHLVDDELHEHFNERLRTMAGFLSGRVTWELMAGFWPTADEDPSNPKPVREYAAIWRETPKVVYSRTLEQAGWNTTIVREVEPGEVRRLVEDLGGDVAVGGAQLASAFLEQGLVDQLHVYVHPVLLGEGTSLFPRGLDRTWLDLAESRTFGNGVVLLRYERRDSPPSPAMS
jgi:dihydrofolate reductase